MRDENIDQDQDIAYWASEPLRDQDHTPADVLILIAPSYYCTPYSNSVRRYGRSLLCYLVGVGRKYNQGTPNSYSYYVLQ